MPKWMIPAVLVFVVIFGAAWAIGDSEFLVPVAIFLALVAGFLAAHRLNSRRVEARPDQGREDTTDPIPSTADVPNPETPLGATDEGSDGVSPHDLPPDHPGRAEAERRFSSESEAPR